MATPSMGSTAAPLSSFRRHLRHFPCLPTTIKPTSPKSTLSSSASSTSVPVTATAAPTVPLIDRHRVNHHHPSYQVLGGAHDTFLPAFKSLSLPYDPFPLLGWNCHVETIFAALFRSLPEVRYRRECLRMSDDGVVALDWVSGDLRRLPEDAPLLILLPGLAGGSGDSYVKHMLNRAKSKGYRVVVLNSRGSADSPIITPKFYSAGSTEDIREVVANLSARYPKASLYAAGWSLGANILVRYLGQDAHHCPLSGAVSLCNPFNVVMADEDFTKGFNVIYDRSLGHAMRRIFNKHALLFEELEGNYNIPLTSKCETVREFHEGLTVGTFGFESVDDYYSQSNSSDLIKYVQTPLLCVQAANDPIAPYRAIPFKDIKENPNCGLVITPKGGHLGWIAGSEAPTGAPWTDPLVMDFLEHLRSGRLEASASSSKLNGTERCIEGSQPLQV